MNEQILKRLQDMLKLQSAILEQLETVGWLTKDIIEDLVLELECSKCNPGQAPVPAGTAPAETQTKQDVSSAP